MLQLLRIRDVCERFGYASPSMAYLEMERGTLPPPVQITRRCVAWPAHEVDAIIAARLAGASDDAVRELIVRLLVQRKAGRPPEMAMPTTAAKAARARERGLAKARQRPRAEAEPRP